MAVKPCRRYPNVSMCPVWRGGSAAPFHDRAPLRRSYRMKLRLLAAATLAALTLTGGAALAQDTSSAKGQLS